MPTFRFIRRPRLPLALRIGGAVAVVGLLALGGQASFSASTPTGYVVRSGDSLWAIATANHLSVSQLASANGLNPAGILRIGTHLIIPSAGSSASSGTSTTRSPSSGSTGSASTANFCATFAFPGGSAPLPAGLAGSPRLALRPLFVQWARAYGVSPALAEAIGWQESGWQESALSSAQAVGVGQLLPGTASFMSQLIGSSLNIRSTSDNIRMETRYLAYLQASTGSTCSTIAAYYEGETNLRSHGVLPVAVPYVRSVASLIPAFS